MCVSKTLVYLVVNSYCRVRRLWVADPALSPKNHSLVKGWGVGSFLLLPPTAPPRHIQMLMVAAGKNGERIRSSA